MINGEGTQEISSEVASPDPLNEFLPWEGQNSDDGDASPVLSQYSSCGESEFERYCSANSVMGTPSLCSSIGTFQECLESEFGSLKSFKLGGDSGLDNFSLGGRFDRKHEDEKSEAKMRSNVELRQGLMGSKNGFNLYDNVEPTSLHELNNVGNSNMMLAKVGSGSGILTVADLSTVLDEGLCGEDDFGSVMQWRDQRGMEFIGSSSENQHTKENVNVSGVEEVSLSNMSIEQVDRCVEGLSSESGLIFDGREAGRCSEEVETSSRYEHSEGEDSMFGYGTDEAKKIDLYHMRNVQYSQEANSKNENSLFMTSSLAFGSDDWDDFMQETKENTIASSVPDELQGWKQQGVESERDNLNSGSAATIEFPTIDHSGHELAMRVIPVTSNQIQVPDETAEDLKTCLKNPIDFLKFGEVNEGENVKGTRNQIRGENEAADYLESCSVGNIFETEQGSLTEEAPLEESPNVNDGGMQRVHLYPSSKEVPTIDNSPVSESIELEKTNSEFDPLSDISVNQLSSASREATEDRMIEFRKDYKSYSLLSLAENNKKRIITDAPGLLNHFEDHLTPIKTGNYELNEFYDEVVHEMEEILLDSGKSPGVDRIYQSQIHLPSRDGGLSASTSDTDAAYLLIQRTLRIDGVEVVGARQKKGDISFSERLVGVKEYTVYRIRVWSEEKHWEVERRYREFCTLYRGLKTLFADQGWVLPSPWSFVGQESRKIFGTASPDVLAERSTLIQECLRSILHSRFSSSLPSSLIWFLSPPKADPSSPASDPCMPQSLLYDRGTDTGDVSTLGKTISLVVEIWPYKSMKQMLEAQHNTCAGCHKHFDDGKTRMWEFVQTLGWGKPRLCQYSGQLFCSSCHSDDIAVLPARVLHFWDFNRYPVSQFAKSYLDSIHNQPMLCVSAVNPFLFSKVPTLQHVTNVRKKIGTMLLFVHCPFRRSIDRGLGSRRYLLESNDFFALRDLIDLSKGVFAALPVMVETVSRKILEHITEQCLICCDVGVPCNARQACDDPSSLIFPFQEGEIERCRSCESVFHKPCFRKIASCPCVRLKVDDANGDTTKGSLSVGSGEDGTSDLLGRKLDSRSPMEFLSGLFSKARPENNLPGPMRQ